MTLALTALEAAAGPILIVLGISAIGFILGKEEVGLLPPAAMKNLSKLTTVVFLPCFFFTKLSANVNMARVFEWWTLPFFVALNMLFGILLGRLLVHFQGHRMGGNRGVVLASCTLGSVGHLPLVLALAACSDGLPKFHLRDGVCKNDAIAMVSFGLWIMTITLWSLGGYLIKCFDDPPAADPSKLPYAHLEEKFDVEAPKPFSGVTDDPVSASTLRENQPHENEATTRAASTVAEDLSGQSAETKPEEVTANKEDDAGKSTQAAVPAARAVPMWIKALSYINPPIAAIFLGLLVGTVPALRGLLLGTSAPLALVRQLAEDVGGAAVPCMLLVLGASMRLSSPAASEHCKGGFGGAWEELGGWRVVGGVTAIRLVLLPLLGALLAEAASRLALLPSDPLVRFVLSLQFSVPTAMNLQLVATVHGKGQTAVTALIIFQYIVAVPTLTLAMMYYLM